MINRVTEPFRRPLQVTLALCLALAMLLNLAGTTSASPKGPSPSLMIEYDCKTDQIIYEGSDLPKNDKQHLEVYRIGKGSHIYKENNQYSNNEGKLFGAIKVDDSWFGSTTNEFYLKWGNVESVAISLRKLDRTCSEPAPVTTGTIIVHKIAHGGGTTEFPFEIPNNGGIGHYPIDIEHGEKVYVTDLPAGQQFTFTEMLPIAGWSLRSIDCSFVTGSGNPDFIVNGDGSVTVTASGGREITCDFWNEKSTEQPDPTCNADEKLVDGTCVPVDCEEGTWDPESEKCVVPDTDTCKEGTWDPESEKCVVPDTNTCEEGTWDSESETCVKEKPGTGTENSGGSPPAPPPPAPANQQEVTIIDTEPTAAGPESDDEGQDEISLPLPESGQDLPFTGGVYLWYLLAGGALTATGSAQLVRQRRRENER